MKDLPFVSIIVPCWNEEGTIRKTIQSLLMLDYPKNKFEIIAVDDGSTDGTWKEMQNFSNNPQVKIFQKENGGKHTAVNLGIEHATGDFIGCLDSDSFVHNKALKRIIQTFRRSNDTMAVIPTLIIHNPKSFIQKVQVAEYDMAAYIKKVLSDIDAIQVTPGPFSFFRKEVFQKIGKFKKAHNTEDQEIALRMHEAGMKIALSPHSFVYTVSPNTTKKLYKQRVRWTYGFFKNVIDYKHMLLKKKYGNIATFTLPVALFTIGGVAVSTLILLIRFVSNSIQKIRGIYFAGFRTDGFHLFNLDWFFFNTDIVVFLSLFLVSITFFWVFLGRKISKGRGFLSFDIFYFLVAYYLLSPFWVFKSAWNTAISKKPSWR
ncbi:glycosyltransferase family 2 protein [Candidatus Nomurabacteria bacterium]|nr:glycosyltransferase family 2 protein [Candidatus Nomurabacteria bacterium]USN94834.1 MAG: glycosyltransferase family 2 protein [Candidatus Nomurabacteria bacterium]